MLDWAHCSFVHPAQRSTPPNKGTTVKIIILEMTCEQAQAVNLAALLRGLLCPTPVEPVAVSGPQLPDIEPRGPFTLPQSPKPGADADSDYPTPPKRHDYDKLLRESASEPALMRCAECGVEYDELLLMHSKAVCAACSE